MAVLDFSAPRATNFFSRVNTVLSDLATSYAMARTRSADFQYFNDMSDAQLAAIGLRREDIARHVFRDIIA